MFRVPISFFPKVKVKVKARARENMQEKETATRTRLDLWMKKLDSAGWMVLGLILGHPVDRAVFFVLRSKVQDCHDGFDGIAKFVDESFFRCAGEALM